MPFRTRRHKAELRLPRLTPYRARHTSRRGSRSIHIRFAATSIALIATLCPAMVAFPQEDNALLKDILARHTANREQLNTWKGEVHVTAEDKTPTYTHSSTSLVQFAWDTTPNDWYYRWEYATSENGTYHGVSTAGMYHNDAWHKVTLAVPERDIQHNVIVTPSHPPKISLTEPAFAPHLFLALRDEPYEVRFNTWLRSEELEWLTLTVAAEDPGLVTVTERTRKRPDVLGVYVFSLAHGGGVVSYEISDPNRTGRYTTSWTQISGVWVPSMVQYTSQSSDGDDRYFREFRWVKNDVNEPLDADTFSLETLKVQKGAPLVDKRSRTLSFFNSAKNTQSQRSDSAKARSGNTFALVVANLVLASGIVAFFLVRAWRRHGKR